MALGMPLSAAVLAATGLGDHERAARLLRTPVPEAMFRTRAAAHYLLARGRFRLAAGQPVAALGDLHACRDLLAGWDIAPGTALDWSTPAAQARGAARAGRRRTPSGCSAGPNGGWRCSRRRAAPTSTSRAGCS